jgi:hypothetical protein
VGGVSPLLVQAGKEQTRLEALAWRAGRASQRLNRFIRHPDFEIGLPQGHLLRRFVGGILPRGAVPKVFEHFVEVFTRRRCHRHGRHGRRRRGVEVAQHTR